MARKKTKKANVLDDWFVSDESPVNFFGNCITGFEDTKDGVILKYKFSAPDYINTAFDDKYSSLKIASTSLRTVPNRICGLKPEPDSMQLNTLIIYGYVPDADDAHSSRLDFENISRAFNTETIDKFDTVKLCGSFKDIEDMQQTLNFIYDNFLNDKIYGNVILYACSFVNDENGKTRTIADLVDSGYQLKSHKFSLEYGLFGKRYYTKILKGNLPDEPIGKLDFSSVDADK